MDIAIMIFFAMLGQGMFCMWAGARYNPLCVERYEPPVKVVHVHFPPKRTDWPRPQEADDSVPTAQPVNFYRDPKTGRFVKT